ncbi:hypothetical protein Val02_89960 [Virgisporangium aliadipatigenens]|uniref:Ankyrin n=1 Tax=Virgisporangium aliadipatigenens TaxID=741659 RepID=A0A8J3YYJ0_9ACTN|nr:hypothetical protein [Virgisporangium aliadipatigenens]GIJ52110.1 hypothetical protein Val02_89960 [Virgisporangium aliadipatigenens]
MREFSGAFETHLTVAAGGPDGLGEWAAAHGFKYSEIVLDRGRTPEQPMLTRHARGTLAEQVAAGREWARRLGAAGHGVVRLKVEASADNAGVPRDAAAAAELPECYFEHHVKVALPDDGAVTGLRAAGAPHGAHVSRNARRRLADGTQERFLTQRCRAVGRAGARARLDALLDAIGVLGVPVLEVEEEFVVYDDNLGLDAGWLG